MWFSRKKEVNEALLCAGRRSFFATASFAARRRTRNYAAVGSPLKGAHNLENALAGFRLACWRDANRSRSGSGAEF